MRISIRSDLPCAAPQASFTASALVALPEAMRSDLSYCHAEIRGFDGLRFCQGFRHTSSRRSVRQRHAPKKLASCNSRATSLVSQNATDHSFFVDFSEAVDITMTFCFIIAVAEPATKNALSIMRTLVKVKLYSFEKTRLDVEDLASARCAEASETLSAARSNAVLNLLEVATGMYYFCLV